MWKITILRKLSYHSDYRMIRVSHDRGFTVIARDASGENVLAGRLPVGKLPQPNSLPPPPTAAAAASTAQQIRQLLRSGDSAGALAGVLDSAPLGGDEGAKQVHLTTIIEVLQGIRQSDVPKVLEGVLNGGPGA